MKSCFFLQYEYVRVVNEKYILGQWEGFSHGRRVIICFHSCGSVQKVWSSKSWQSSCRQQAPDWGYALGVGPGQVALSKPLVQISTTEPIMLFILWPPDVYIRRRLLAKAVVFAPTPPHQFGFDKELSDTFRHHGNNQSYYVWLIFFSKLLLAT